MKTIVGSIVAIVTPMQEDGSVDYDALRRLIDWHIAEGTDCIGVVGTTGESPTVSFDEHFEIIRVAAEHAKGRVPIMAGTGGNSTREAIELSEYAKKVAPDSTLSVVPYYNKPSQEGILKLLPLHRNLFIEPSPAPTKWAMAKLGLCGASLRLPITPLTDAGQAAVEQALRDAGLL